MIFIKSEYIVDSSSIFAHECAFEFLNSFSNGGAIFSTKIIKLEILKSQFIQCRTYEQGGSIFVEQNKLVTNVSETCFDLCSSHSDNACFYMRSSLEGKHSLRYVSCTRSNNIHDCNCQYYLGERVLSNINFSRNTCWHSVTITSYYEGKYTCEYLCVADNFNEENTYRIDRHYNYKCLTKDSIFVNNNVTSTGSQGCIIMSYDSDHTCKNCYLQNNKAKYAFWSSKRDVVLDGVYGDILTFIGGSSIISIKNETNTLIEINNKKQHLRCFNNNNNYMPLNQESTKGTHNYIIIIFMVNFFY